MCDVQKGMEHMKRAEALDILKTYREELNTALSDVDGIPVVLEALDFVICDYEKRLTFEAFIKKIEADHDKD